MSKKSELSNEELQSIGDLMIEIIQSAAEEGMTELTIGDLMRIFGHEEEAAAEWDDVTILFIEDSSAIGHEVDHTFH